MTAASERAAQRLRAGLDEQRAALGEPAWAGPGDLEALGRACTFAVVQALAAGQPPHTAALREAARFLAGLLAARAPGKAVEVRVPPYAAVQCIEGPRHTRGTPPNLVEMDPVTWVRLAAGVTAWADARAAGTVRASGVRADLGPYLPVLEMPGAVGAEH
ncbi:MAG TPA: sterol carrier family protein [Streptosporangiaceae bacterium]|nr:sterol carrier family protein [Streptosporangiaceae bacterium]